MHVILGVLGTVATLMFAVAALKRSGVSGFNPHALYRRVQWNRKAGANPLFTLTDPVDVASVLLVGTAKCEGEMTVSQKKLIVDLMAQEFSLERDLADDQMVAAAFMIRHEVYIVDQLSKILAPIKKHIDPRQRELVLSMMQKVAACDGEPNQEQLKLLEATESLLSTP